MTTRRFVFSQLAVAFLCASRLGLGQGAPPGAPVSPIPPSGSSATPPDAPPAAPPAAPGAIPSSPNASTLQQALRAGSESAKAVVEAQTATNVDDANKAVEMAVANKDKAINSVQPDKLATLLVAATAIEDAAEAQKSARDKASSTMCGMNTNKYARWWCLTYGLYGAALSQVNVQNSDVVGGQTTHRLASIAVPYASVRFVPLPNYWGFVAIDAVALYSAFLSKDLSAASTNGSKQSCSQNGGDFERTLPCEADAVLHPYIGFNFGGITFGKAGLGFASLIPFTYGLAQAGSDAHLRRYWGWWSFGALQINGTL